MSAQLASELVELRRRERARWLKEGESVPEVVFVSDAGTMLDEANVRHVYARILSDVIGGDADTPGVHPDHVLHLFPDPFRSNIPATRCRARRGSYLPGFLRAALVVSTNSNTSNSCFGTMSATRAYGSPSGYTAPI